jgi:hypothetical protein
MFLQNSRYFNQKTMTAKLRDGRTVAALEPRRLPSPTGVPTPVKGNDRLDIIAQRQYQDSTRFWRIADANTQLEARLLIEPPAANSEMPPMNVIQVPLR